MSRYASAGGGPLKASQEFKEMVKALHGAGIEVNHFLFSQNGNMSIFLADLSPFLSLSNTEKKKKVIYCFVFLIW